MADQIEPITSWNQMLEVISSEGFEGMGKAVQILVNKAMHIERERFLGAKAYERSELRTAHGNGFKKNKTLKTRVGELNFLVP